MRGLVTCVRLCGAGHRKQPSGTHTQAGAIAQGFGPSPCCVIPLHLRSCWSPLTIPMSAALPEGTPLGGPAMLPLSGGAKKGSDARRPLIDVTGHFAAHDAGSICIGALGGSFGMPTDLQPAAQLVASCRVEAARAAQARAAVVKRQALRSMR